MRGRIAAMALAVLMGASTASAAETESAAIWLISLSGDYGSWSSGDVDSDGTQSLGYLQASYDTANWGVTLSGSMVATDYKTIGADGRFSVTTLADTDFASYYALKRDAPTLRFGLDARAPTGKATYTDEQLGRFFVDDLSTDLMLLNSFGQGAQLTPHVMGVYRFSERFTAGAGLRYSYKGEYDPSSDQPGDTYKPGDQILAVVNAALTMTRDDFLMATVTYAYSGKDKQEGIDVYRQGDTASLELRYMRRFSDAFNFVLGAYYQTQQKNERISEERTLGAELSNSNNNLLEVYVSSTYRLVRGITLYGLGGVKTVGANGYVEGDGSYDAGRSKVYVEPGIQVGITDRSYLSTKVRYSRIVDKADAYSDTEATYNVYNIDLSYTVSF